MELTGKQLGTARRRGTEQGRTDSDFDRPARAGVQTEAVILELVFGPDLPKVSADDKGLVYREYLARYDTKREQIKTCEHDFKGRTERAWGMGDQARCINCNVLITAGNPLPIDA